MNKTRRTLRTGSATVAALGLVLTAAACSSSSSGKTGTSASPTVQVQKSSTAAAKSAGLTDAKKAGAKMKAPTGKKIAFMYLSASTEASVRLLTGLKQAAKIFGFQVITCDPNFDPAKTAQCMTTLVAQKPDLILVQAAAPTTLGGGLKTAADQGIPVIMTGALEAPSPYLTAEYVPDEQLVTKTLDHWLLGLVQKRVNKGPATIGAFQAPTVGPGVIERDTQRAQDLKAYPGFSQTTHDINLPNAIQDTISQTKTMVAQNPHLQALWQTCDFCAAGNAQALDQLGLTGAKRPLIGAIYTTQQTRQEIQAGKITGAVELNFGAMAWVAVDQAVEHWARHTPFAKTNAVFENGYGIKLLQPWIVTKDNVGNPAVVRNQGEDYQTYFETKWKAEFGV